MQTSEEVKKQEELFQTWIHKKREKVDFDILFEPLDMLLGGYTEIPYINNGKAVAPSRNYLNHPPEYGNFIHLIVSSCFYASVTDTSRSESQRQERKMAKKDVFGSGKSISKAIEEIRSFNGRNKEYSGMAFRLACYTLGEKYGIEINSAKSYQKQKIFLSADEILDKILSNYLDSLTNTPCASSERLANLRFPKQIKSARKNPCLDGLVYEIAYLIQDWKNEKKAFNKNNHPVLPNLKNYHPEIISSIVNSLFDPSPHITPTWVSQRLTELKEQGAMIYFWL